MIGLVASEDMIDGDEKLRLFAFDAALHAMVENDISVSARSL